MNENNLSFTVGIPTYNSSIYLTDCLNSVIESKFIDEIIISDDCSVDEEIHKIESIVKKFRSNSKKNIKFLKNNENKGAFFNKYFIVKQSKNKVVYILDSDNLAAKNIDKVFSFISKKNDLNDLFIQPNTMQQFWKYPNISKFISIFNSNYKVRFFDKDRKIDLNYIKISLLSNSGGYRVDKFNIPKSVIGQVLPFKQLDKWIMWILNCGNFIVSKDKFLLTTEEGLKYDRKLLSIDAVVFSYLWLKSGNQIEILKNFYHHHRKREDSVSFKEKQHSNNAIKYFINKILSN